MMFKIKDIEIEILAWYGWKNKNTALFHMCHWGNPNWGITILPLRVWDEFWFMNRPFGYLNKRFGIGFGLGSFYFDSKKSHENN